MGHHRGSLLATPVDSPPRFLVPGRGVDQSSGRGLCGARLCADVLAESAAFDCVVSPSHLHRPATLLRSAPFPACLWGSAWSALANSSHDVSHHRTASGNCSLGPTPCCRTHTSSGASYRERNRWRKHPERTNGTPRPVSDLVHSRAAFGALSPKARASERNASCTRTVDHLFATSLGPDRPQPVSAQGTSIGHRQNVNGTSTGHQPSVNGTSTNDQQNVNGTSIHGFSRREWKKRLFGAHQRTRSVVWLTGRP